MNELQPPSSKKGAKLPSSSSSSSVEADAPAVTATPDSSRDASRVKPLTVISDQELSRHEFFEALINVANLRYCKFKNAPSLSDTLYQSVGGQSAAAEVSITEAYRYHLSW